MKNADDATESRIFSAISSDISDFYKQTSGMISSNSGRKSAMWAGPAKLTFAQKMLHGPLVEAIRYAQNIQTIYTIQAGGSVDAGLSAEQLLDDLQLSGFDLDSTPPEIREAEFTAPERVIQYNGRPVSVDFLYRLNICQHLGEVLNKQDLVVLEIGAGLGALPRTIKLLNPKVKYIIIDLLDTLVVSYGFLRASFPAASTTVVHDSTELAQLEIKTDFTFIPAEVVPLGGKASDTPDLNIPRLDIDLVVNTQSLGEMRQDTVDSYIDLIENRLNVKRFYSLNRFLEHERIWGHWRDESFISTYCTFLDPFWEVLRWEFSPPFVGHTRVGDQDQTLELYVERIDPGSVDQETLRKRSEEFLAAAQSLGDFKGPRWHRLMWDSIRLCPRKENVEPYYHFLKASHRRPSRYFGRLLASYGVEIEEPYTLPSAPKPLLKRGPRHLTASALKRITDRIQPPDANPEQSVRTYL